MQSAFFSSFLRALRPEPYSQVTLHLPACKSQELPRYEQVQEVSVPPAVGSPALGSRIAPLLLNLDGRNSVSCCW